MESGAGSSQRDSKPLSQKTPPRLYGRCYLVDVAVVAVAAVVWLLQLLQLLQLL